VNQDNVRRLRDAITGRSGREVEVSSTGEVRELRPEKEARQDQPNERPAKATKLAARTFGVA